MTEYGTCWHDESRGLLICPRNNLVEVNIDGYGASGCATCKTVLGLPIAPAGPKAEPFAKGWRNIPKEYMG